MNTYFKHKITIVSFILAIFVVYIHTNNTSIYTFEEVLFSDRLIYLFENWCQRWQNVAIPLFFIISSFLFFYNIQESSIINKLKKRVKTLFIPYCVWSLLPWIILCIVKFTSFGNKINQEATFSINGFFKSFVLCEYSVMWYIRNLMIYFAISYILQLILKNKLYGIIAIFSVILLNSVCVMFNFVFSILYWLPMFMIGAYLGLNYKFFFMNRIEKKWRIVSIVILIILLLIAIPQNIITKNSVFEYLYRIAIPLVFWFALDIFDFNRKPYFFEYRSFQIYCTHALILELLEKIILITFGNNVKIAFISYIFTPIITILLIIIITSILKSILPKLYYIVFGNRG